MESSVGYTGGNNPNPTYQSVCRGDGHTEAIRIKYDPTVLPTEKLMETVLTQAGTYKAKPQYMSAVWAQSGEQEKVAKQVAKKLGKDAVPILPAKPWTDAEEYHQKYIDKQRGGSVACGRR